MTLTRPVTRSMAFGEESCQEQRTATPFSGRFLCACAEHSAFMVLRRSSSPDHVDPGSVGSAQAPRGQVRRRRLPSHEQRLPAPRPRPDRPARVRPRSIRARTPYALGDMDRACPKPRRSPPVSASSTRSRSQSSTSRGAAVAARRRSEPLQALRRREARVEQGDDEARLRPADARPPTPRPLTRRSARRRRARRCRSERSRPCRAMRPAPTLTDEDPARRRGHGAAARPAVGRVRVIPAGRDRDDGAEDPGGMLDVVVQDGVERFGGHPADGPGPARRSMTSRPSSRSRCRRDAAGRRRAPRSES